MVFQNEKLVKVSDYGKKNLRMPQGMALTIGLNSVNPAHYGGWSGDLIACEADAQDMSEIAKSQGFSVKSLLTKTAIRQNVMSELAKAASNLRTDDILMLSYSGHGGQVPDMNKDSKLKEAPGKVKAPVLLISGYQDNQYSSDGIFNGLFTATLLRVWNDGNFKGDYRFFHKSIQKVMPPDQTPYYCWIGKQNPEFEA